jgi:hypothetical protein
MIPLEKINRLYEMVTGKSIVGNKQIREGDRADERSEKRSIGGDQKQRGLKMTVGNDSENLGINRTNKSQSNRM